MRSHYRAIIKQYCLIIKSICKYQTEYNNCENNIGRYFHAINKLKFIVEKKACKKKKKKCISKEKILTAFKMNLETKHIKRNSRFLKKNPSAKEKDL